MKRYFEGLHLGRAATQEQVYETSLYSGFGGLQGAASATNILLRKFSQLLYNYFCTKT